MAIETMEPTNIPCGRCGAPMHEDGTSHLAANVAMRCVYCGAVEMLPADAGHRVLAIRAMRMQRRWAEDAARGPALAYLKMMEGSWMFVAPYGLGALLVAASLLRSGVSSYTVVPIGIVVGIALASFAALRLGRRRLNTTLVPLIRALPAEPGRPQRCRRCGGALPASPSAFVSCRHCDAPNLASRTQIAANHAALAAQRDQGLAYAAETTASVAASGRFVARAMYVAFVVGAAGGGALGAVVARVC